MKKVLILVALLLLPVAYAQLDWVITDFRCGNGVIDEFELCEKGVENSTFCDALGTVLEIDTACDTAHCTCLPRVNKAFCGNNIREGVEVCDGLGEDKCAEFGVLINMSLSCNPKTCGCTINETIPKDYNPEAVQDLVSKASTPSDCGNKKVEGDEDCDPPNTLCTIAGNAGVCTEKCKCISPDMLGVEEPVVEKKENVTQVNVTPEVNLSDENVSVNITASEVNVTKTPEEPGFFGRLWAWIAGLFN